MIHTKNDKNHKNEKPDKTTQPFFYVIAYMSLG